MQSHLPIHQSCLLLWLRTVCSESSVNSWGSTYPNEFQQIGGTQNYHHHWFLNEWRDQKANISNSEEFLFPLSFIMHFSFLIIFLCCAFHLISISILKKQPQARGEISRCGISLPFWQIILTGYLTQIHPSKVPHHLAPKLPEPILLWKWLLPLYFPIWFHAPDQTILCTI